MTIDRLDNPHVLNLFFTNKCNLACTYCFVDKKNQRKASLDEVSLKRSVDLLFDYTGINKTISFKGGEPLLEWLLLKKTCLYAEKEAKTKGLNLNLEIVTNGTLLTQQMVDFFIEHKVFLKISIDGKKESHDKSRLLAGKNSGSTFDLVFENIKKIDWKGMNIAASMVIVPGTAERLVENLKFLNEKGFIQIDFYLDMYANWTKADILKLKKSLKDFKKYYVETFMHKKNIFKSVLLDSIVNELKLDRSKNCFSLQVSAEGNVYMCDKVFSLKKESRGRYSVGNVSGGIDDKKRLLILAELRSKFAKESKLKCVKCAYQKYCFCPIGQYIYYENNAKQPVSFWSNFCKVSGMIIKTHIEIAKKLEYNREFVAMYRF